MAGQGRRAQNAKSAETTLQTLLRLFPIAIVIVIAIGYGVDNDCDYDDDEDAGFADSMSDARQGDAIQRTFRRSCLTAHSRKETMRA